MQALHNEFYPHLLNAALSFRLLAFVCPQLAPCSRRPPRKHVTQQNNLARRLGTVAKVAAKFCMHDLGSMQSSKNKFLQHAKANLQTCPGAIYPPNPAKRNARLLKARQLHRAIHLQTNPPSDKSIKELRIIFDVHVLFYIFYVIIQFLLMFIAT